LKQGGRCNINGIKKGKTINEEDDKRRYISEVVYKSGMNIKFEEIKRSR
jgi:hypothetical protein